MIIWNKKKKITVDAFTKDEFIASTPIAPTSKYLPDWYKKLKNKHTVNDNGIILQTPTFKTCDGMLDNIKKSFTIPMWADLYIKVDPQGFYGFKYPGSQYNYGIEHHGAWQVANSFDPMMHVKIHSPWILKEKTGVEFYQSQAFYSFNSFAGECLIPPGVVNYKYQNSTHINMFLKKDKQYKFDVGMGMMYLHPLTEHDVEIKTHVIDETEYNKLASNMWPTFEGGYKKNKSKDCPVTGN